tara:strand:+ start:1193 stop:2554 length:1362 start_codon:yes stop_codon:yes gene_type:complete
MSIADRRNSLRKSSLGIDRIRKSITSLNEGLEAIGAKSRDLLKQTRDTNEFKRKLIRQDGEFFKRRRENALRKQREDELEASTITGVTKRQGSLVQKSTRGFLGRILDFLGILLLGWALTNLPKIIAAFEKLFGLIKRVVGVLGGFVEGMKDFLVGIGTGISNFLDIFRRFNFSEDDKNIRDTLEQSTNNLTKLNKDFVESAQQFANDPDINSAGEVAKNIGIVDGDDAGGVQGEIVNRGVREKDIKEQVDKALEQNVDVEGQTETVNVEPRAEGGDVVKGQPYLVGEEGPEIFQPDEDGTIIPNDQLLAEGEEEELVLTNDDVGGADNVEGVNENDPMSVTPSRPSGGVPQTTASTPDMSIPDDEMSDTEEERSVEPIRTDKSLVISPVKKSVYEIRRSKRKRKKIIVPVGNQNGGSTTPSISGGTKTNTVFIGQTSEKTLLDLQSLNNKHN